MNRALPAIGYIGLGLMGSRMATRLLNAGYPLTVFDRTQSKADVLSQHGATVATSPRLLAEHVDVVILSVTDGTAVDQAILGPDGAIGALSKGKTVIDMSTIAPSTSRSIAQQVAATGASMLDAPVSGSTPLLSRAPLSFWSAARATFSNGAVPFSTCSGKRSSTWAETGVVSS